MAVVVNNESLQNLKNLIKVLDADLDISFSTGAGGLVVKGGQHARSIMPFVPELFTRNVPDPRPIWGFLHETVRDINFSLCEVSWSGRFGGCIDLAVHFETEGMEVVGTDDGDIRTLTLHLCLIPQLLSDGTVLWSLQSELDARSAEFFHGTVMAYIADDIERNVMPDIHRVINDSRFQTFLNLRAQTLGRFSSVARTASEATFEPRPATAPTPEVNTDRSTLMTFNSVTINDDQDFWGAGEILFRWRVEVRRERVVNGQTVTSYDVLWTDRKQLSLSEGVHTLTDPAFARVFTLPAASATAFQIHFDAADEDATTFESLGSIDIELQTRRAYPMTETLTSTTGAFSLTFTLMDAPPSPPTTNPQPLTAETRHLTVTFERVEVLNDGDTGEDGELRFTAKVNGQTLVADSGFDDVEDVTTLFLKEGAWSRNIDMTAGQGPLTVEFSAKELDTVYDDDMGAVSRTHPRGFNYDLGLQVMEKDSLRVFYSIRENHPMEGEVVAYDVVFDQAEILDDSDYTGKGEIYLEGFVNGRSLGISKCFNVDSGERIALDRGPWSTQIFLRRNANLDLTVLAYDEEGSFDESRPGDARREGESIGLSRKTLRQADIESLLQQQPFIEETVLADTSNFNYRFRLYPVNTPKLKVVIDRLVVKNCSDPGSGEIFLRASLNGVAIENQTEFEVESGTPVFLDPVKWSFEIPKLTGGVRLEFTVSEEDTFADDALGTLLELWNSTTVRQGPRFVSNPNFDIYYRIIDPSVSAPRPLPDVILRAERIEMKTDYDTFSSSEAFFQIAVNGTPWDGFTQRDIVANSIFLTGNGQVDFPLYFDDPNTGWNIDLKVFGNEEDETVLEPIVMGSELIRIDPRSFARNQIRKLETNEYTLVYWLIKPPQEPKPSVERVVQVKSITLKDSEDLLTDDDLKVVAAINQKWIRETQTYRVNSGEEILFNGSIWTQTIELYDDEPLEFRFITFEEEIYSSSSFGVAQRTFLAHEWRAIQAEMEFTINTPRFDVRLSLRDPSVRRQVTRVQFKSITPQDPGEDQRFSLRVNETPVGQEVEVTSDMLVDGVFFLAGAAREHISTANPLTIEVIKLDEDGNPTNDRFRTLYERSSPTVAGPFFFDDRPIDPDVGENRIPDQAPSTFSVYVIVDQLEM